MKTIRKHLFTLTIIIILIITNILLLLKLKLNETSCYNVFEETSIIKEEKISDTIDECTVDIKGAIKNPGVYTSNCDKYVYDIISMAGGLNDNADTSKINLAKKITNEMVIVIYDKDEVINHGIDNECHCPQITNDSCLDNTISQLININTAPLEKLKTLPGIGEAKAKAIIEYRNTFGGFKDISDIIKVNGIGEGLYEQIKVFITT